MWKILKRYQHAKSFGRKVLAEKRASALRRKSWKRRERKRNWERYVSRFQNFLANPFGKKEYKHRHYIKHLEVETDDSDMAEVLRIQAQLHHESSGKISWQSRNRKRDWAQIGSRLKKFVVNPFADKELTSEQREKQRIKRYIKRDRASSRQKLWVKFKANPYRFFFHSKKHKSADGGCQYLYKMSRTERREIARMKRAKARESFRLIFSTPELRKKFGFSYLQSTASFLLAFIIVYVIYQVITIMMASSFRIPVVWYYYQLQFPLYTYSPLYTRSALVLIFSIGPIISLLIAFVFLKLFFTKRSFLKRFQLFYLWGFICGINMFFGAYIAGFFTRTEFIYTTEWLFLSDVFDTEELIFTVISFALLLGIGRTVTPLFLESSGSVTMIKPEYRVYFFLSRAILPWLSGVVILFLITLPAYYIPLILKTITPGLVLLPSLFLYNSPKYENIHRSGVIQRNYFRWSVVIAAVALLFFYRILLSWGLKVM